MLWGCCYNIPVQPTIRAMTQHTRREIGGMCMNGAASARARWWHVPVCMQTVLAQEASLPTRVSASHTTSWQAGKLASWPVHKSWIKARQALGAPAGSPWMLGSSARLAVTAGLARKVHAQAVAVIQGCQMLLSAGRRSAGAPGQGCAGVGAALALVAHHHRHAAWQSGYRRRGCGWLACPQSLG